MTTQFNFHTFMGRKTKFKEGDRVAHRSDLNLKLLVERILFETHERVLRDESGNGIKNDEDSFVKTPVKRIAGIECSFSTGNEIKKIKLHSLNLVPWEVAKKGETYVELWLKNNHT